MDPQVLQQLMQMIQMAQMQQQLSGGGGQFGQPIQQTPQVPGGFGGPMPRPPGGNVIGPFPGPGVPSPSLQPPIMQQPGNLGPSPDMGGSRPPGNMPPYTGNRPPGGQITPSPWGGGGMVGNRPSRPQGNALNPGPGGSQFNGPRSQAIQARMRRGGGGNMTSGSPR